METKIILASQSPRRKELLEKMGFQFKIIKPEYEEIFPIDIELEEIPLYHSKNKAIEIAQKFPDSLIIAADTVVIQDGILYEKPRDLEDAKRMISELQGNTHQVVTGITVASGNEIITDSDTTQVSFLPMNEKEIDFYIHNHSVLDKAGAYGVQDWIGLNLISNISGSYFTIMGLPTHLLYQIIKNHFNEFSKI